MSNWHFYFWISTYFYITFSDSIWLICYCWIYASSDITDSELFLKSYRNYDVVKVIKWIRNIIISLVLSRLWFDIFGMNVTFFILSEKKTFKQDLVVLRFLLFQIKSQRIDNYINLGFFFFFGGVETGTRTRTQREMQKWCTYKSIWLKSPLSLEYPFLMYVNETLVLFFCWT